MSRIYVTPHNSGILGGMFDTPRAIGRVRNNQASVILECLMNSYSDAMDIVRYTQKGPCVIRLEIEENWCNPTSLGPCTLLGTSGSRVYVELTPKDQQERFVTNNLPEADKLSQIILQQLKQ